MQTTSDEISFRKTLTQSHNQRYQDHVVFTRYGKRKNTISPNKLAQKERIKTTGLQLCCKRPHRVSSLNITVDQNGTVKKYWLEHDCLIQQGYCCSNGSCLPVVKQVGSFWHLVVDTGGHWTRVICGPASSAHYPTGTQAPTLILSDRNMQPGLEPTVTERSKVTRILTRRFPRKKISRQLRYTYNLKEFSYICHYFSS